MIALKIRGGIRSAGLYMLLIASLIVSASVTDSRAAIGQGDPMSWSEPIYLAGNVSFETWQPQVISDSTGKLHAIWLAWNGPDQPNRLVGNSLYYAHWDGARWSTPIDILVAPGSASLDSPDLVSTPDGVLLLVWASNGDIFLSKASVRDAGDAKAWTTQLLGSGANPHIVYDSRRRHLYLTLSDPSRKQLDLSYSMDLGRSWSSLMQLWATQDTGRAIANEDLEVDHDGSIHAVWVENTEQKSWQGEAVWHGVTSSDGVGLRVREVMRSDGLSDPTLGSPNLLFDSDGSAYLFWNNGVSSTTGRFYETSYVGSNAWSGPTTVFPSLSGQTGPPGLAFDSKGTLHLATAADGDGYGYGVIRYATMNEGAWSTYTTLVGEEFVGEHPSLLITTGDHLHMVWTSFEKAADTSFGRVAYSSMKLDVPFVAPASNEFSGLARSSTPTATLPADNVLDPIPATNNMNLSVVLNDKPSNELGPITRLLIGIGPVLLLVLVVLVVQSRRHAM